MGLRTLLILALLVAVLGAFIWFFERELPSSDERRELASKLLPIEADDVESLTIEKGEMRVRVERGTAVAGGAFVSEWRLVEPFEAAADSDAVTDLLKQLTSISKDRSLEEVELAAVGLERPRLLIALDTKARTWRVALGSEVPATESAVLQVAGEGLFVASERFVDSVPNEPIDWRSRDALSFEESAIDRIVAATAESDLALSRTDDDFVLESPVHDEVDSEKVEALLRALDDLSVASFVDEPSESQAMALEKPAFRINLRAAHEISIELELAESGEDGPQWLARLGDQLFLAETDVPRLLEGPVSDWQSRRWTRARTFEIESARVAVDDRLLNLERRTGSWFSGDAEVPYAMVADLLDSLTGLEGERVVPRESHFEVAEVVLKADVGLGERTESLTIVSLGEGTYRALPSGRDFGIVIGGESVNALLSAFEAAEEALEDPSSSGGGD